MKPSEHLSWSELACKDGTPYPERWRKTRLPKLAGVFERIRIAVIAPIVIGSAYRTPAHQAKVNPSAPKSQHVQGRALDLHTPKGWSTENFHLHVRQRARIDRDIGGVGYYRWGVHIDTRPRAKSGRVASWNGGKAVLRA